MERHLAMIRTARTNALFLDFAYFVLRQLRSVLFAGLFFVLLATSRPVAEALGIFRYDWLFFGSLFIQAALIALLDQAER
jgi:uncharacterized membrane protein YoaT (DUF817 family)